MRPSVFLASCALSLFSFGPSSSYAQASNAGPKASKVVYGTLADPADTARKRSSGAARLDASKSTADKTVRDSSGHITKIFEPDASGKLTVETDFEYNEAGKLTAIKQIGTAGTPVRSRFFVYDAAGQLTSETSPEQGKILLTLDKNNFLHSTTDARAVTKTYYYDAQQRLLSKTYSDGSPAAHFRYRSAKQSMFVAYVGDKSGQDLQKVERYNKAGALDGTLQKYVDGNYATARLAYDSLGRIRKIFYPDGRELQQTWNRKGQLTSIKSGTIDYFGKTHYAGGDDLLTASLGAGLTLRKAYDTSGRLSELAILNGQQVLFGHRYHYNAIGSVEQLDDLAGARAVNYTYDQLNRVSSFKDSDGGARTFSYDAAGNLENTSATDGNSTVDAHNRLHSSAGLSYDSAGEMTFDGTHAYTYNAEDLITTVDGGKVHYVYNAMGDLIERISPRGTENFLWLHGQLLAKRETDGTWTDYLYVNGQRIASLHKPLPTRQNPEPQDVVTYFVTDRVGLARAAVMVDGTITAAAVFSPFGKPLADSPLALAAESISYSGEIHDSYSGLNIYQYRSYNPQLGRWMSPDPSGLRFADLTNPQTFNLYTFVINDPTKYFDAHGLYADDDGGDDDGGDGDKAEESVDDGPWGQQGGGGGGGSVPPVTPVNLGCGDNCGTPPTPPDPTPVDLGCPDCTPGDPGIGDPGTGDPGTGDPGSGDPGSGDPSTGDPGTGSPTYPCANGVCLGPGPVDPVTDPEPSQQQDTFNHNIILVNSLKGPDPKYVDGFYETTWVPYSIQNGNLKAPLAAGNPQTSRDPLIQIVLAERIVQNSYQPQPARYGHTVDTFQLEATATSLLLSTSIGMSMAREFN